MSHLAGELAHPWNMERSPSSAVWATHVLGRNNIWLPKLRNEVLIEVMLLNYMSWTQETWRMLSEPLSFYEGTLKKPASPGKETGECFGAPVYLPTPLHHSSLQHWKGAVGTVVTPNKFVNATVAII